MILLISQIREPLLQALPLLSPGEMIAFFPCFSPSSHRNTAVSWRYSSAPFFDPKNDCPKVNPYILYLDYYWTKTTSWFLDRYFINRKLQMDFSVDLFPSASFPYEFPWKYPACSFSTVHLAQAFPSAPLLLPFSNSPSDLSCPAPWLARPRCLQKEPATEAAREACLSGGPDECEER